MFAHPLLIAGFILAGVAIAGLVASIVRENRLFAGFREIASDAKTIATRLRAEIFRDGDDLVISGHFQEIPTVLRFSTHENTPALRLEARIPATFHFSLTPKQFLGDAIPSQVRLVSPMLEQRCVAKSKDPVSLELLLKQSRTLKLLESLCCSSKTVLEVHRGRLEVMEMIVPDQLTDHVLNHLAAIHDFAAVLATLPGSDNVKVVPINREHRSWLFKGAVAAGFLVAALSLIVASGETNKPSVKATSQSGLIHGVPANDASRISGLDQWRAMEPDEIDPDFATWMRDSGIAVDSRIEFSPSADTPVQGVAYLLVKEDGTRRLVVLVDHHAIFDACFPRAAGIARVPFSSFAKLQWDRWQAPPRNPTGDGILLVRDANDAHSGVALFFPNGNMASGVPQAYPTIELH